MAEPQEVAEQLRKDYKTVFLSEAGQRILDDLKKVCYFNDTTLNEFPHIMSFNEGSRSVILHIETKLKLTAIKLKELQNERGES